MLILLYGIICIKHGIGVDMEQMKQVLLRIVAVFAASGLKVVGAGAIAGIPIWLAVLTAGIAGVATVVENLARAYLDDGKLDTSEINAAFNKVDKAAQ